VLQSSASQKEKADACRELGRIGSKDAVAPLAALLKDDKLSHMARYGLEPIDSPAVDAAFRKALSTLKGLPLVGVINSVGVRRDAKAINLLADLLLNADPQVAQASARALGAIGTAKAAKALAAALPKASPPNKLSVYEGLLRCAERLNAAGSWRAALAIYDPLRESQAPPQVRTAGLRGSILLRGTEGIPIMLQAIRGSDFSQFDAALRTAKEMPSAEVTLALVNELPRLSPDKQQVVLQILADRGDVIALPAITAAARTVDKSVRLAAIRALARFGNPAPASELRLAMRDPDKDIARAAQESFAALPGREINEAVLAMISNGDSTQRLTGMELATRRRMVSALPILYKISADPDTQVRTTAVRTIGELSGPEAVPAVLGLLIQAKAPEDLEAAEQALGVVASKSRNRDATVQQLAAAFDAAPTAQKSALLRILTSMGGPKALALVQSAVKNPNADVCSAAIRALSNWSTVDAAPDLLDIAKNSQNPSDKSISLRGYLGMASQGDQQSEAQRLALCRQATDLVQKPEEKKMLLAALGSMSSPEAIQMILPYLRDDAVKEEAATAVVGISEKLLKKPDPKTAEILIPALTEVAKSSTNAGLVEKANKLLQNTSLKASGT
jgi:HEAT repeat protein